MAFWRAEQAALLEVGAETALATALRNRLSATASADNRALTGALMGKEAEATIAPLHTIAATRITSADSTRDLPSANGTPISAASHGIATTATPTSSAMGARYT